MSFAGAPFASSPFGGSGTEDAEDLSFEVQRLKGQQRREVLIGGVMTTRTDIALHLGGTWELDCECRDGDEALIDIQAAEWRLANRDTMLVKVTVGSGITVTGPGKCRVKVPSNLQDVVPGLYDHELWVIDAVTGIESIQIIGRANVVRSLRKTFP